MTAATPGLSDDALIAWRTAAENGEWPSPWREDRWQPLRAGVVNLWEFEVAEYWYAAGWVQLTGRNETGKSSLMALTTLIPWLGDTSTANIDTLGDQGKRFRYYVEPTTNDGDRRDANASTNRGWLWVEYGRLVRGEPRFLTVALFADARRASTTLNLTWATAEGEARVRRGLDLVANGMVTTAAELGTVAGVTVHGSARDYRARVADRLLGSTADRLEAAGKLLRVTRTPKLGERLNLSFVSSKMREALPELERAEIEALASGWDQLDRIRGEVESAKGAAAAVRTFTSSAWLPWARARLRRTADEAAAARTAFDAVTRRVREATSTLETLTGERESVQARRDRDDAERESAEAARDELRSSARFTDATGKVHQLALARQRAEAATATADAAAEAEQRVSTRAERSAGAADTAEADVQPASGERAARVATLAAAVAGAGISSLVPAAEGHDFARLAQAIRERQGHQRESLSRWTTYDRADRAARVDEDQAAAQDRVAAQARTDAEAAWDDAGHQRDRLADRLAAWTSSLVPEVAGPTVDAWIAALPTTAPSAATAGGPSAAAPGALALADLVRRDWYSPAANRVRADIARAELALTGAESRAGELERELADLASAPVPSYPAPAGWARRDRVPGIAGAPLWALVDPIAGGAAGSLARLEAALAAMGLLDAWVTPDGVYRAERDGDDAVVDLLTPALAGASLATRLTVADPEGPLAPAVAGLLERLAVVPAAEALPDVPFVVSDDGRWRTPLVTGRAQPLRAEAEWLGEPARRAATERRLQELRAELAEAEAAAERARTTLAALAAEDERLSRLLAEQPTDRPLVVALATAAERTRAADGAAAAATASRQRADRARAQADGHRSRHLEHAAEHRLPVEPDHLRALASALERAEHARVRAEDGVAAEARALAAARGAREVASRDAGELADARAALARRRREAAEARETAESLAAHLDADTQQVLDEVARLERRVGELKTALRDLEARLSGLRDRLATARAQLDTAEADRGEATRRRDAAFSQFRALIDTGLDADAGVALPDRDAVAVDKVRDQVAALRAAIPIPDWPEDAAAQQVELDRRWSRLVTRGEDVRTDLEAAGRTIRLTDDDVPRLEIVVDSSDTALSPPAAAAWLARRHEELAAAYDERVQTTLSELLGSTFIEHLQDHLGRMRRLVAEINGTLGKHPTGTARTALRILVHPRDAVERGVVDALENSDMLNDEVSAQVRLFLRGRIEEAREKAVSLGEAEWRDRLAAALDYREWFEIELEKRSGTSGRWTPLTPSAFAGLSGGARAVMLMLPLVATLAALYDSMDGAPRPLWLDEAFDGLDTDNRAVVLDLFREFDLDVLVAGPGRLVNAPTVPVAAIYQVVRAPDPHPGADLTLELWAGGELHLVDLPAATSRDAVPPPQDGPDLFGVGSPA